MKQLKHFIAGEWQAPVDGATLPIVDPATEAQIASMPVGSAQIVDQAVKAAKAALVDWSALSVAERSRAALDYADTIEQQLDELAELERQEMGKPPPVGRAFLEAGLKAFREGISDAADYDFERQLPPDAAGTTTIIKYPLGVVAVIVPWNFTVSSVLLALGPLLVAGNTVIIKPSEKAPLSAAQMVALSRFPAGVINLVLGDGSTGASIAEHPDIALVHFTGSVASGRSVGIAAAQNLHRSILELGGKDPVIVDSGVDVRATAAAVAEGAFVNTGQICTSMERIYVHKDVADEFVAELVDAARNFAMADEDGSGGALGPLVDERQREIVHRHVEDAQTRGATVHIGGEIPDRRGFYYPATVMTDVTDDMLVMIDETFGPVAPIQVVPDFDTAVTKASNSEFGLAATVFSNDPDHIAAARCIPAGIIWINKWQGGWTGRIYEPAGISGMGATGGRAAYDAATRPASIYTELHDAGQ